MAAPKRRSLDLRTFDQLTADVARLQRLGYDQAGRWSLEQVLDHLTKSMMSSLDETHGLPRPMRLLFRPVFGWILSHRSMPRMPAPPSLKPPAPPAIDEGVHNRFAAMVQQASDLTRRTIDHPAFGKISTVDWQQLQLIHASRHLSFLIPRSA